MLRYSLFFLLVAATAVLTACGPKVHYQQDFTIPESGWSYTDTLDFPFAISDTNQIYDLYLELDHSATFPNQNLYLQIYTRFPTGQRIKELVSLELAGSGGIWFGKCSSENCRIRIPIQTGAYFDHPGDYLLTLEQYTRRDTLPGLNRIGFEIVETQSRRSQ